MRGYRGYEVISVCSIRDSEGYRGYEVISVCSIRDSEGI